MQSYSTLILYLVCTLLFGSCSNVTTVNFTSKEKIEIKDKRLKVVVYGYDETIADVSADIIHEQEFEISALPFSISLDIPSDPYSKISYLDDNSNARFYLSFDWDSNGDGKESSQGDISFDWDVQFPSIELGRSQNMTLKTIKD